MNLKNFTTHRLGWSHVISFKSNEVDKPATHTTTWLMISLTVSNYMVKRILVENGSSTNILFLETLVNMGMSMRDVERRTTISVEFNNEMHETVCEIMLSVYTKGLNNRVLFNMVNAPYSYNIIIMG